jgi:hypothetical protein
MEKYKDKMDQLVPQPDRFLVRDQALSRRLRAGHQMCGGSNSSDSEKRSLRRNPMPYLFHVTRGKEKKVVDIFGQHGVLAKKALIGEYVVACDPRAQNLRYLDSVRGYIRNIATIEDKDLGRFLGMREVILPARGLKAGQIVRILSGEFEDFRGVVRRVKNGRVAVDVTVFGRLRPVVLNRDEVLTDGEVPEGWSQS